LTEPLRKARKCWYAFGMREERGPRSSPDPRIQLFLDQWERDIAEGKTVRALFEDLEGHLEKYDRDMRALRDSVDRDLQSIRDSVRLQAESTANQILEVRADMAILREELAHERGRAENTGRFMLPPPTAPANSVEITRPSTPHAIDRSRPSKEKRLATNIILLAASAIVGWLLRHLGLK